MTATAHAVLSREIAGAVDIPVSIKLRRGVPNGSRSLGPRLVPAGRVVAARSTRARRSRCTPNRRPTRSRPSSSLARGRAGRRLGRRHVPLAERGGARDDRREAVMVGRGARRATRAPCARSSTATPPSRSREEVAAELVLLVRRTARELGERRASGFLKKFYGSYWARTLSEGVQAGAPRLDSPRRSSVSARRAPAPSSSWSSWRAIPVRRAGDARAAGVDLRWRPSWTATSRGASRSRSADACRAREVVRIGDLTATLNTEDATRTSTTRFRTKARTSPTREARELIAWYR